MSQYFHEEHLGTKKILSNITCGPQRVTEGNENHLPYEWETVGFYIAVNKSGFRGEYGWAGVCIDNYE